VQQAINVLVDYKLELKKKKKKTGCSIMSNGWTDKKDIVFVIFLVNSPKGIIVLSSVDTFNMSKIVDKLFEMLDVIVKRIKEENVV
jgi:hypothetical protein